MKLIYITKEEFEFIKDDLVKWFHTLLEKDIDTVFHFSGDLTKEDREFIYQHSDSFIIDKNKIINIDEKVVENVDENFIVEDKYEIIMKAGKKLHNKLQKYPIQNMGIINLIDTKIDKLSTLVTISICLNFMTIVTFCMTYG